MQLESKVGPKGQVVIPKPLRKARNIRPGDHVSFREEEGGILIAKPSAEDIISFLEAFARKVNFKGKYDSDKAYDEMMEERFRKLNIRVKK